MLEDVGSYIEARVSEQRPGDSFAKVGIFVKFTPMYSLNKIVY